MATTLTPQEVADKWANNLSASVPNILKAVQRVTVSPTQAAANAADNWLARLNDPHTKTKFISGLNRVSLQDWIAAFTTKGANRIASGATASKPKFTSFMQQWLPYVQNIAAQVRQMPKGGLQNGINRAVAQITGASKFQRQ